MVLENVSFLLSFSNIVLQDYGERVVAPECCDFHHDKLFCGKGQISPSHTQFAQHVFLKDSLILTGEKILRFTIWLHNLKQFPKTFGPFLKQNFFENSTYFLQEEKKKSPPNITFLFLKKSLPLRT